MRYFELDTQWGRPHVRAELSTLEEAKQRLDDTDIHTETLMGSHPELADALERWDRGDRLLRLQDQGRYVLCLAAGGDLSEALIYVEDDPEVWRQYGSDDPICGAVIKMWDDFMALQEQVRALGIPFDISDRSEVFKSRLLKGWDGPDGDVTQTKQEEWDMIAARWGPAEAESIRGPRPTALESV